MGSEELRRDLDMGPVVLQLARGRKALAPRNEKPHPCTGSAEEPPEDPKSAGSTPVPIDPGRDHSGLMHIILSVRVPPPIPHGEALGRYPYGGAVIDPSGLDQRRSHMNPWCHVTKIRMPGRAGEFASPG